MAFINSYFQNLTNRIYSASEIFSEGFKTLTCTDEPITDSWLIESRAETAKTIGISIAHFLPLTFTLTSINTFPEVHDYFDDKTITILKNAGAIGSVLVIALVVRNYQKYNECKQLAHQIQ